MSHDDEADGRAYDHRLMRRLMGYLRPYRREVTTAVVVVILDAIIGLAGPYLTKQAIDHGIRHRNLEFLNEMALVYLSVLLVGFGLGYLHHQIMQRVGQRIMLDLRLQLFAHLQRLPLSYFDRHPVGRVMTRVTNDVDVLNELFTSGVVAVFGDLFVLIGIVIAMANLNFELMAVAFSVLPLIVIVTMVFRSKVRRSFRDIRTRLARLNSFLNENLGGMTTVQILNREDRNHAEFRGVNAGHRDANLQTVFYHALFFPALELVGAIALSLIVWYGGRQVMWEGITLGILVAFIQYVQRFFRPISDISEKYGILQQAMASSERIFDLLDTPVDPALTARGSDAARDPDDARAESDAGGRIEFDHVWFAYRDEHWVLEDVSFIVEPGEQVAVVGAHRFGQEHGGKPAARLLHPPARGDPGRRAAARRVGSLRPSPAGRIRPAGRLPVHRHDPRQHLARGPALRSRTRSNARHARSMPMRSSSGSRRATTPRCASAGRPSRRDSARCWRSPARWSATPDLLVLDEATSSVDTHTEARIQDALTRLFARPHRARHRPPAVHDPGCRPDHRPPPGKGPRDRHARRVDRRTGHLCPPPRAPVPGRGRNGRPAGPEGDDSGQDPADRARFLTTP